MRFKQKVSQLDVVDRKRFTKTYFAFFPIKIGEETRWLEKVCVEGYYYVGAMTGAIRFMETKFIDK